MPLWFLTNHCVLLERQLSSCSTLLRIYMGKENRRIIRMIVERSIVKKIRGNCCFFYFFFNDSA